MDSRLRGRKGVRGEGIPPGNPAAVVPAFAGMTKRGAGLDSGCRRNDGFGLRGKRLRVKMHSRLRGRKSWVWRKGYPQATPPPWFLLPQE